MQRAFSGQAATPRPMHLAIRSLRRCASHPERPLMSRIHRGGAAATLPLPGGERTEEIWRLEIELKIVVSRRRPGSGALSAQSALASSRARLTTTLRRSAPTPALERNSGFHSYG